MKRFLTLTFLLSLTIAAAQQKHTASNYESIESIAKTYRFSPADIIKVNPGLKEGIQKGVTINIPVSKVKHYSTQRPVGFTSHVVQPKETFFGLAQKYSISIDDLKRYNLELYTRELQENERVTIPLFNKTPDMVQKGIQGQKRYVVKPQETLWKIAKNHNVSVEELERMNKKEKGFNPNNLKEGQEIWIPANAVDTTEPQVQEPARPNSNKDLVLYFVEKGEGFYSLERKFGLSEAEIVKLNPAMKDGLKTDAQIWIPKENYDRYRNSAFANVSYSFENSNNSLRTASSPTNVREISYILPFKVADITGNDKMAALRTRLTDNKVTPVATDFYSGALIALDSLQKMGYKFKVNVFDSEGDLKKIAANPAIQSSQVVIGPFANKAFNILAPMLNSNTAILAPLSNKNISLNPNVYQTLPTDEVQQAQMIAYLTRNYGDANVLILADSKNASLRERLERVFPNAKVVTEMSATGFANALTYGKENVVILQSNDISYVSLAVRLLHNALKVKKNNTTPKITLTTVERGTVFDSNSLSNNQLSDLRFTYPTINKYSNGNDTFSSRYLKTYGILPNKYAIRGFDLTMDTILRLGVAGNLDSANSKIGETSFLENKFAYLKNSYKGGGYENQGVYIVQYDNMEIKTLDN